jgi:general secretion pathway protein A
MYEAFYGLNADPFRLSVESQFCFPHRSYARAKAYVQYALHRAEGFVMITGSPGTGKTTLVNDLLEHLPKREVVTATLVSTQLEADDLLRMAAYEFGLESQAPRKSQVLQRLMEFFAQLHQQGLRTLLIIDEAQDLAPTALEELRLLTNLQRSGQPLLQIVLLGQESLADLIRRPEMEQVHQRLVAAWQLEPLDLKETIGYVRYRLEQAGWRGDPAFEPGVLKLVHEFSQGIPRRINLICSRLLLHGAISELHTLTADDARGLIEELRHERLSGRKRRAAGDDSDADKALRDAQPSQAPTVAAGEDADTDASLVAAPASQAPPQPPAEDPDEIDQGLKGPVASPDRPAAPPRAAETTEEDPPAPVGESAPRRPEPPMASAPEPDSPAGQAKPLGDSEPKDREPAPGSDIRAVADEDRSTTPGLHWQYVPDQDEATSTNNRNPGGGPRHTRRAGWIKALLLFGGLLLVALALSYPVWEASVPEIPDQLLDRFK